MNAAKTSPNKTPLRTLFTIEITVNKFELVLLEVVDKKHVGFVRAQSM